MTDQMSIPTPEAPEESQDSVSVPTKTDKSRRWIIGGAAVAALITAGVGVAIALGANSPEPRLQNAYEACQGIDPDGMEYVSVTDGGKAITIDTEASYNDVDGAVCVISGISTPEYIVSQITQTNALMGVQNASADGYDYSWSYHPDNGMNMTIVDTRFDS